MTSLRLIAEGLEDDIFEPERTREQLRLIRRTSTRSASLIDDLFELSRLEAGDIRWSIEQVQLDELRARDDRGDATRTPTLAASRSRPSSPPALAPARGNPEQLQRVLFNLIQNAIRHTPADGSVVVRAEPVPGPGVEVEIADSGDGIDPDARERIFEPFFHGPTTGAGANGSAGLGLAVSRAIVEAHGGRIWLAEATAGARVRFSLPVA